jgi:hypothetical protein
MGSYTLANVLVDIRGLIVKARSVRVNDLLLDDAEDILDRLVRMDHICLEIKARIDGIDLEALTRMRPDEEFPASFQRGGAVTETQMIRESNGKADQ